MTTTSTILFPETGNTFIDGLLSGAYWNLGADRTITWGLGNTTLYTWGESGYQTVKAAIDAWENIIDVNFSYAGTYTDYSAPSADIVFTLSDSSHMFSNFQSEGIVINGFAIFPEHAFAREFLNLVGLNSNIYLQPEGDVFLNLDSPVFQYNNFGSKAFQVILHEIGHAIGLKHPHDGGVAGYTTYLEAGLDQYDNGYLTLMSYDPTSSTSWEYGWATSPLPFDILTAQTMYGANTTANAGDTTYILYDDGLLRTFYDVSGIDTFDVSNITHAIEMNLSTGNWTDLGALSTVYIALGTTIENAIGTNWDDYIDGGEGVNVLNGLGGDDQIQGFGGNDIIFGDLGADLLFGNSGDDELQGGDGADLLIGQTGDDKLFGGEGNDELKGGIGNDYVEGDTGNDTLFGEDGNDLLFGDSGNDHLIGGNGDDALRGGLGNDFLWGQNGDDYLDGGIGIDTAKYAGNLTNYTIQLTGIVDNFASDGIDALINIERLEFADTHLAIDLEGNAGQAYRIYKAAFDRMPDMEGLGYWIAQIDGGVDLIEASARFIDSNEFRTLYGSSPTDEDFLTALYGNVLDREPDGDGYVWWLGQLEMNPEKTWEKVLADFSESPENQANVVGLISNGIEYDLWS